MKYYWLTPKDQKKNNWVLHCENQSGVSLRNEYTDLQCTKCRKLDELAAIERGIDADVAINSSSDFLITDDGFVCVSQSLRDSLASHNVSNVDYLPIPASDIYFIMLPTTFAPIVNENVGMEFHRPCMACGRFRETCFFPTTESFAISTDPFAMNAPDIKMENVRGRLFWYCVTQALVSALKPEQHKGLEFTEAY